MQVIAFRIDKLLWRRVLWWWWWNSEECVHWAT